MGAWGWYSTILEAVKEGFATDIKSVMKASRDEFLNFALYMKDKNKAIKSIKYK